MTAALRPPIAYFGGKITVGPAIAALLPPHSHYVEPYCGSLAVLLAKPPSPHETVNDLDQALITFWRVLRDREQELARVCALTPHARTECRESFNLPDDLDDLELARRVWVQLTQGRGHRRTTTGWWHYVKPDGGTSAPGYLDGYLARMAPAAARLRRASLECRPALEVIADYGAQPDVLLYVDPPYLGSTRADGGVYVHEMRSEADHRELAEALHTARAAVVLSGYPSDLYDRELYPGWDRHTIAASTEQGRTWANRTEVLWSNRPLGRTPALFDLEEAR